MSDLLKMTQGFDNLEDYRCLFINLALPLWVGAEPTEPKKTVDEEMNETAMMPIKAIPPNWTIWDTIIINNGPMTIQQLLDWLEEHYKLDTDMILCDAMILYNAFGGATHTARASKLVEDVTREIYPEGMLSGKNYIILGVEASLEECGTAVTTPRMKYVFD
jgi:ubiquitin-activating enzyme E1